MRDDYGDFPCDVGKEGSKSMEQVIDNENQKGSKD